MTYPIPEPVPPTGTGSTTITLTLTNDEQYWHILIGHLMELGEPESFDDSPDAETVAAIFEAMLDGATYADV